jgi:hypothetical protein
MSVKPNASMHRFVLAAVSTLVVALAALLSTGCLSNASSGPKTKRADASADAAPIVLTTEDAAVAITEDAAPIAVPSDDAGVDAAMAFFPVGGQVTGLVGSGLVLQDNGGDTLSIPSDGTFVFPTQLTLGAPYAVSVLTQPTAPVQVCSVASGQGLVSGPVTGVVVTCSTQSYAVGGQLVGLASTDAGAPNTGLVLTNALADGGVDQLPLDQNGSFAFPTLVASGATYAIAIASQPAFPAQTCTVSGGTGTVGSAPVTSAVVNCATNAYVVSGSVTGLAGQGLVLANGTNTATITADGSFAFSQPLQSGTTYDITVATQPTNPSQNCVVTNATGIVKNGNVSGVGVACTTSSFTIGGAVSSLAGSGLVLQSGTGETLPVTTSGSFTFKTPVASGAPFSVTVKTQPTSPWQVCTVTGGSGTVGNGPVGDVAVSCKTSSFTVGGSVSGLSGTGLALSLNGGSGLSIAASGAFTFPGALLSGTAYQVTIASSPTSPNQTCTLTSGASGTIAGSAVTNVAVACSTNAYAIGGTVLGLTGSGLTLTDNGGDALSIPPGATSFTFKTAVASGATYSVSVSAQPTGPSQTCTVSGGSGTVVSGAVSSVIVNCGINSFTVGGTVGGLAGSGLVLANGAATLSVTANGSFAFATPVASGGTYDVTVKTQPTSPSQTCAVANPQGSVGSANVISVAVTCTTNSFAVGGSVGGLSGSGLVLLDNGGDSLAVSASGGFTFATPVLSGTPYAVTVGTQPTTPWQTCAVTKGSGTMGNAAVSNVGVACTTNTYAVGGQVKGLAAGDSVSLTLNGGAPLTVGSNTTFTFPTSITSGSTYAVAVSAQPSAPSQTCTVTGGNGTIAGAAVSGVVVSCSTNSFSVGGSVSGLQGTGLTLTDNGGDAITLGAGAASFTFPTQLQSGSAFLVQIQTQPSSPTQQCTITGQTGTVGAGNVTSVSVNCNTSSFSVGGTVAGLKGSGLVLANGSSTVSITGNGSFAFATPVASGGSYAVTVQTPPSSPTQVCTVASGTGTVTNTNVGSVQVTCKTSTFSISVTVSGLQGSGLVLADNGTDTLAVSANGTFAFAKKVASGAGYAVTVPTQPTSPWQSCVVGSTGSGTVGSGPVSGITVTCSTLAYTVGGYVSGVSGSGVTLTLNGGDAISVTTSGGFGFPGTLLSGATYSVAVSAQPYGPTQYCSVTNDPSGTIQGSAIGDVQVTCNTTPFQIGGQIVGLTGSGLVLTDNGGDSITIPAGATSFAFPTYVLSGNSYDVEVSTNPTGPTQSCSASANTGVVGAGNVGNVLINCNTSSFTVSGTISGLTGSGLQLTDGAGQTIGVSGTSFSFLEPSGTPYDVTVAAQPTSPWETCTLTSGVPNGTISNVNVSGIVFTCTPNVYTVSGTVTGLSGSGLELCDGDGNTIPVAANPLVGSVSFSENLASGTTFGLWACAQPTTPWQTCNVTTGGKGTVANTNIGGIGVTCTTNTYTVTLAISGANSAFYTYDQVNGGSDNYLYDGNGSFDFPAEPSESTYSIGVYAPPAYETCYVYSGNQSGTLTDANVTVDLYCYVPTYDVIVSVSQECNNPVTVYSGYQGGSIGSIAYSTSTQYEYLGVPNGQQYSASWSGSCDCWWATGTTTSGTINGGSVSMSLTCMDIIQ